MPISNGSYVAPTWVNDSTPPIDASELQDMCDSIESYGSSLSALSNISELWSWKKYTKTDGSYALGDLVTSVVYITGTSAVSWQYASSIKVANDGTVSLVSPTTVSIASSTAGATTAGNTLKGKFGYTNASGISSTIRGKIIYFSSSATFTYNSGVGVNTTNYNQIYSIPGGESIAEYLTSSSSSAYPVDGQSGGYWYKRLGKIGEGMTRLETGAYLGTGTYGSSNPNSITFSFEPKMVVVTEDTTRQYRIVVVSGQTKANTLMSASYGVDFTWSGKTVQWYSGNDSIEQLNRNNYVYHYVAIG